MGDNLRLITSLLLGGSSVYWLMLGKEVIALGCLFALIICESVWMYSDEMNPSARSGLRDS